MLSFRNVFWSSIGFIALVACGGVAREGRRGDTASDGSGGTTFRGAGTDAGTTPTPVDVSDPSTPAPVGAGGIPGLHGAGGVQPGSFATGGAPIFGGVPPNFATGGVPPSSAAGGAFGGTGDVIPPQLDAGSACHDVFEPKSWEASCSPSNACLSLDPGTWSAVSEQPDASADSGAEKGGDVAELPFCQSPSKRRYLFAFNESGAHYDAFNIVTGDSACSGRSLAYIGVGGIGDEPLTKTRTHCFSVDGSLLGKRLAIVSQDPDAVLTHLRAVTACPCPYPVPYNVNSCPGVEGSAGHPNCG